MTLLNRLLQRTCNSPLYNRLWQAASLTYVWYITNNNDLCKKDTKEQHAVHFLRYEYIERLRRMTKLLHLSTLMHCTLLYHIKCMLCYFLVPTLQQRLCEACASMPCQYSTVGRYVHSARMFAVSVGSPEAVYQKAYAIGWKQPQPCVHCYY